MNKKRIAKFQQIIWDFYKKNKRTFPWRETKNPYRILVSEIMLQQTQTDRVVDYYKKFIKRFPNFETLAEAKFSDIYPLWQGLGYNRRALALQKTAQKVVKEYQEKLPQDILLLKSFPGIGPYTARAVAIFSWNMPISCIETNIRRVFIHYFFPKKENVTDEEILPLIEATLDTKNSREWHWALMDYGAYLKSIIKNPNRRAKNYNVQSKFEGSSRQIRGEMLKALTKEKMDLKILIKETKREPKKVKKILATLIKEGFVKYNSEKKIFSLT